jgi:hypothetical protein
MVEYKLSKCTFLELFKAQEDLAGSSLPQKLKRLQIFAEMCVHHCTKYDDCFHQDEEIAQIKNEIQNLD